MKTCTRCSGQMLRQETSAGLMWVCILCSHDEAAEILTGRVYPSLDRAVLMGSIVKTFKVCGMP